MNQPCILALGFFDGVHLGHAGLLRRVRELATQRNLTAAALTFDNHPDTLVRGHTVPLLNTSEDRAYLMRAYCGIDEMRILHFDHATMTQPWQDFVLETLVKEHRAAHVVCGHDFRFGAKGVGTPEKLAELCQTLGIGVDCIPEIRLDGTTVSSTHIRALIERGEMAEAVRFLGHPHILTGEVVGGQKLGRRLGIPTANLLLPKGVLIPRFGVYAAKAYFDSEERLAVVNVGVRPTVQGIGVTVEPWLLDFDGNLYGKKLRLEFREFLRTERKFPTLDALKAEILRNAEQTRNFFRV